MIGQRKHGGAGSQPEPVDSPSSDPNRDLGFGAVVSRDSRQRLLNRDGSFNVVRSGLGFWSSISPYHFLLTTSWPRFLLLVLIAYLGLNALFALAWTVVHPIDEASPLWSLSREQIESANTELLVMIQGFDETFSQTVHTRSSYTADELIWGARFANLFNPPMPDGTLSIDVGKLHDTDPAALPEMSAPSVPPAEAD